jgi:predicted dehydrogenase
MTRRLGVGFVGSGFITRFHIRSWEAVRDADVRPAVEDVYSGAS